MKSKLIQRINFYYRHLLLGTTAIPKRGKRIYYLNDERLDDKFIYITTPGKTIYGEVFSAVIRRGFNPRVAPTVLEQTQGIKPTPDGLILNYKKEKKEINRKKTEEKKLKSAIEKGFNSIAEAEIGAYAIKNGEVIRPVYYGSRIIYDSAKLRNRISLLKNSGLFNYESGNDAPRGGKVGEFHKFTPKQK